jgi:hypothetical protein
MAYVKEATPESSRSSPASSEALPSEAVEYSGEPKVCARPVVVPSARRSSQVEAGKLS